MGVGNTAYQKPERDTMTNQPETLETPSLLVRVVYCEHIATVVGESCGHANDTNIGNVFGLFTLAEAQAFIVRAMRGQEKLPYGMTIHEAEIFAIGDDYEDATVQTWQARTVGGSKCRALDPHEAQQAA